MSCRKNSSSRLWRHDPSMTDELEDLTLVTQPSEQKLNDRQLLDYRNRQEKFVKWCLHLGKKPKKNEGYSPQTLEKRIYRIDQFYRWIWEKEDRYTTDFTTDHADEYMKELVMAGSPDELNESFENPLREDATRDAAANHPITKDQLNRTLGKIQEALVDNLLKFYEIAWVHGGRQNHPFGTQTGVFFAFSPTDLYNRESIRKLDWMNLCSKLQ